MYLHLKLERSRDRHGDGSARRRSLSTVNVLQALEKPISYRRRFLSLSFSLSLSLSLSIRSPAVLDGHQSSDLG